MILYLIFLLTMLLFVCLVQRITIFHITLHVSYLKRSFVTCRFMKNNRTEIKSFRINKETEKNRNIDSTIKKNEFKDILLIGPLLEKLGVNNK